MTPAQALLAAQPVTAVPPWWVTPAVRAFAGRHLEPLEETLAAAVRDPIPGLAPVGHAVARAVGVDGTGGKRWRPLLVLGAAEACGAVAAPVLGVAAAIELTHTASLVLDDLPCMDDAATRRGEAATHRLVGASGALLVAIGLLGRAAELIGQAPHGAAAIAAEWGRTIGFAGMTGGQAVDVAQARCGPARGAPRRLLRRKTTALSALAVTAGARAVGARAATVAGLERFGRDLGWAYQLADDVHDLAEDADAGRSAGGRSPARQAQFILRRAVRRLRDVPGLRPAGASLLAALARELVPDAGAYAGGGA